MSVFFPFIRNTEESRDNLMPSIFALTVGLNVDGSLITIDGCCEMDGGTTDEDASVDYRGCQARGPNWNLEKAQTA